MSDDFPKDHADLKALAKKLRRPLATLYALSSSCDPFMVGQPYRTKRAHWFLGLYKRFGIKSEIHGRDVFYTVVSQRDPVIRPGGKPFENTVECSQELDFAIRDARYIDLIPGAAIIDRRNPPPIIKLDYRSDTTAEIETEPGGIERHEFGINHEAPDYSLPTITLLSEPHIGQRYHLEIWIEKSTGNDVLIPLGDRFRLNIATFVGETSATACKDLVDRAIASGKPVRILHITDFDPAGRSMPVAAAAKIAFELRKRGLDLDIQFEHVALTHEQCVEYELPRIPIKESEKRGAKFEDQFDEGSTELDALQALHPGALRQILLEQIGRFFDDDLDQAVSDAVDDFKEEIDDAETKMEDRYADEIAELDKKRDAITKAFEKVHEPARAAYDAAVAKAEADYTAAIEVPREEIMKLQQAFVDEAEPLLEQMADDLAGLAPDPDLFDWPEPADGDEWEDPLYDSARGYIEQVDRFREFQGKDADVRRARDPAVTATCTYCGKVYESKNPLRQKFCSAQCTDRSYRGIRIEDVRGAEQGQSGQET